jgi:hypothetical protein
MNIFHEIVGSPIYGNLEIAPCINGDDDDEPMEWGTLFYDKHKYVYISYFH